MPYYKKDNILFLHIPKTGGMSIESTIFENKSTILNEKICPKYNVVQQHLTYKQIKNMYNFDWKSLFTLKNPYTKVISDWENIFVFAFVRNPYTRIVSEYSKHWSNSFDSFEHFINTIKNDYRNPKYNNHLIPQTEFIYYKNNNVCDFVGRQENYEKDYYKLCDILNIDKPMKFVNKWKKDSSAVNSIKDNKNIRNIIYEMYEKDFNLLSYDKEEITL